MAFCLYIYSTEDTYTNMTIYITDTTLNPAKDVTFNDYNSAVQYLEGMSIRAYGQTRKAYMVQLESIGFGEDDQGAVTFVRSLSERFEIGVIREGRKMRCDITTAFAFNKPEYGS